MIALQRVPRAVAVVFAVLLALALAFPLMGAKGGNGKGGPGGNSAVAQLCNKGGWQALAPADDAMTAFASEEACVSHGAKGGEIVDLVVETRGPAQIYCEDTAHGVFNGTPSGAGEIFTCVAVGTDSLFNDLADICFAAPYFGNSFFWASEDATFRCRVE